MRSRLPVVVALGLVALLSCARSGATAAGTPTTIAPAVTVAPLPLVASTTAVMRAALVADAVGGNLALAVRVTTVQRDAGAPIVTPIPEWAQCPQWWPTALDVGWQLDDMPILDHVMARESHCNPSARNPLNCAGSSRSEPHARGLTQLCGWTCNGTLDGCLDPAANLARAHELFAQLGWRPWCYNDGVTPRC